MVDLLGKLQQELSHQKNEGGINYNDSQKNKEEIFCGSCGQAEYLLELSLPNWKNMFSDVHLDKKRLEENRLFSHNLGSVFAFNQV